MHCARHGCPHRAVTFHGVTRVVFGYCQDHRCCAACGWWIGDCTCPAGVTERPEYVEWARETLRELRDQLNDRLHRLTPPEGNPIQRLDKP